MPAPTLDQLRSALETVLDPEIKRNIVELDMVDDVEIDDAGHVTVTVLSLIHI